MCGPLSGGPAVAYSGGAAVLACTFLVRQQAGGRWPWWGAMSAGCALTNIWIGLAGLAARRRGGPVGAGGLPAAGLPPCWPAAHLGLDAGLFRHAIRRGAGHALEVPLLLVALEHPFARTPRRADPGTGAVQPGRTDRPAGTPPLHDRLRQVVTRYAATMQDAAVVYIDLVNYPASRASRRIGRRAKPAAQRDQAAPPAARCGHCQPRGEARFGLVLEGVSSRSAVTDRAARLIAAGLMPLKGLKPEVTLQFHMAAVLLDERLHEAHTLVERLTGCWAACRRARGGRSAFWSPRTPTACHWSCSMQGRSTTAD
jgi:hypothetical protein